MKPLFRKLKWLTEQRRKEADLRAELQFHLKEEAERRQAEGLSSDEARRAMPPPAQSQRIRRPPSIRFTILTAHLSDFRRSLLSAATATYTV
jgi:hypothetical protein